MITVPIVTSKGVFHASFSPCGLARLKFPKAPAGLDAKSGPSAAAAAVRPWVTQTRVALERVLRGLPARKLPPLDLACGTAFQRRVWQRLRRIPAGRTLSYGDVASAVGCPRGARAVGQACGANPIPILVPCHRVLASTGRIGGFSADPKWKRWLLEHEGVRLR
jgi:O-6-methylguanine DNA methyltransferase